MIWLLLPAAGLAIFALGHWSIQKQKRSPDQLEKERVIPNNAEQTVFAQPLSNAELKSAEALRENSDLRGEDATSIFQNSEGFHSSQLPKVALTIVQCADSSLVGKKFPLTHFPFNIGRADADLIIAKDLALSREHILIDYRPGKFTIRDLQSRNGTYVNGGRLAANREYTLLFGATIGLSSTTKLAFNIDEWDELPNLAGVLLADRYRLTRQLHSSSKAAVYAAEDEKFPRELAIKVLSPKLTAYIGYTDQFGRDAKTAAQLQHPHIGKIIEYGETDLKWQETEVVHLSYLCMELMKAGNLSDRVTDNQEISIVKVIEWVDKLSDALDYAHRQGFIHGGIKPSCVLFDTGDNPYLTDFAIAIKSGEVSSGVVLGASAFLAPEQWEGLDPTPATDQYSFSVLLYLLLTGGRPYEGQENPDVRKRNFLRGPIPAHEQALHNGRSEIPVAVSQVLARAMASNPEDRYPSMAEFSRNFEFAVTSQKEQPNVFLSYKRGPSAGWANLFKSGLETHHKFCVFVDTERQDSAARFPDRLRHEIERCDVFVCFLTDETLDSQWVNEEIRIAYENQKPMIPIFQEGYSHSKGGKPPMHIESLLAYNGVHLLDQRNMYVKEAIEQVAEMVKKTGKS